MSKRTGAIAALVLSTVLWIAVFLVPLLDAAPKTKWFAAAVLYGGSYVFFFAAIALVGREGYEAMKESLLRRVRRPAAEHGVTPAVDESVSETSPIAPSRAGTNN